MKFIGLAKDEFIAKHPRLYRYLSIERALELFDTNRIQLRNPAEWKDPFEKFYLKKTFVIKDKEHELPIKNQLLACSFSTTISEASWQMYTPEHDGIRITFDTKSFLNSLTSINENSNLYIGPVEYIKTLDFYSLGKLANPLKREIIDKKIGKAQLQLFLKKRLAFEYEQEIRLMQISSSKLSTSSFEIELLKCALEVQLHPLLGKNHAAIIKKYMTDTYTIRTTQSRLYKETADRPIVLLSKENR